MGVGTVLATDSNYRQQIGDSSALFIGTQWGKIRREHGQDWGNSFQNGQGMDRQ